MVAGRLPDRKRASTPKTPRDSVVRRTFLTKAPPRDVCRCSSIVNTFYTFPFQCWDMSDFTDKYKLSQHLKGRSEKQGSLPKKAPRSNLHSLAALKMTSWQCYFAWVATPINPWVNYCAVILYTCGCVGFVSSSFIIVSVPVGFQSIQYWISPVFYDIIFAILVSREYLNMITPMQIDSSPNLSIKIN